MVISSVTSLLSELSSVNPALLNEETICVGSSISETIEDVEGDLSAPEAEFEQVFVSSPLDHYENEGARESPVCQEARANQKQSGNVTIDNVCQESFFEDSQHLRLVSVDKIIQGQENIGRPKLFRPLISSSYSNSNNDNFEGFKGFDNKEFTNQQKKRGWPKGKPRVSVNKVLSFLGELEKPASEAKESTSEELTSQEMFLEAKKNVKNMELKTVESGNRIRLTRKIRSSILILPDEQPEAKFKKKKQIKCKNNDSFKGFKGFESEESNNQQKKRGWPKGKPRVSVNKVLSFLGELEKPASEAKESKSEELTSELKRQEAELERKKQIQCKIFEEQTSEATTPEIHNKVVSNASVGGITASTSAGNDPPVIMMRKRRRRPKKSMNSTGFKCNQCGRVYKYLRGMRQHQRLECNVEPQFPCPYCPTKFRYRQGVREHVRGQHEQAFPKWYATHYVTPHLRRRGFDNFTHEHNIILS